MAQGSSHVPEEIHLRKEQKKARFSIRIVISDYIVPVSTVYTHESLGEHDAAAALPASLISEGWF